MSVLVWGSAMIVSHHRPSMSDELNCQALVCLTIPHLPLDRYQKHRSHGLRDALYSEFLILD